MKEKTLNKLNDELSAHMRQIERCTISSERYGRLILATPPETRYHYVYPRDTSCAIQYFRRLITSPNRYDTAETAYELMGNMARFIKDVQSPKGHWGQRYSPDGEDKAIYKQEDNVAHGIATLCNYLLTAHHRKEEVADLEDFLEAIRRGMEYGFIKVFRKELNLFYSTTSIHESAMEEGFTCWVNFAFLYAFTLAEEVFRVFDHLDIVPDDYFEFPKHFYYTVRELFMAGDRYVRRIGPRGNVDLRPDFTLLSPFYFGFVDYKAEMENNVRYLEKQLWDPELGMIMRYLPFHKDFAVHVHAGNGPWLQYTAILAQYHYWNGNESRGDELLRMVDHYRGPDGGIPEHLSTSRRFERFMELEWKKGIDFEKEFHKPILLKHVDFNKILEEANNMARSYEETAGKCMIPDKTLKGGGYIQFAMPLMWAHVEYSRALLFRAGDWWPLG